MSSKPPPRAPAPGEPPRASRTTVRDPEAVLISVTDDDASSGRGMTSPLLALVPVRRKGLAELGDAVSARAAWVLAHVDGQSNVATIVKHCALPEEEVLELLRQLAMLAAIETP